MMTIHESICLETILANCLEIILAYISQHIGMPFAAVLNQPEKGRHRVLNIAQLVDVTILYTLGMSMMNQGSWSTNQNIPESCNDRGFWTLIISESQYMVLIVILSWCRVFRRLGWSLFRMLMVVINWYPDIWDISSTTFVPNNGHIPPTNGILSGNLT